MVNGQRYGRKIVALASGAVLCLGMMIGFAPAANAEERNVPDVNFAACIAGNMTWAGVDMGDFGYGDDIPDEKFDALADPEVGGITGLACFAVADLTGIDRLTFSEGKTSIWLSQGTFDDLGPLVALLQSPNGASVTDLSLEDGELTTGVAETLTNLPNLTDLSLINNKLEGIITLTGLPQLKSLNVDGNQLAGFSVEGSSDLSQIWASSNNIDTLDPKTTIKLDNPEAVTALDLGTNKIADISSLGAMTKMENLYLNSNPLTDISAVANMSDLSQLDVSETGVSKLTPLAGLARMSFLAADGCKIADLTPLTNAHSLTTLFLSSNQISALTPLAGLTGLVDMQLGSNSIIDISPLAGLTKLAHLDLSGNHIKDVKPLDGLASLWILNLADNDIDSLADLTSLAKTMVGADDSWIPASIDVRQNSLSTLDPIAACSYQHYAAEMNPECTLFNAVFQTLTGNAQIGIPQALPAVSSESGETITWTAMDGSADITGGNVTFNAKGTVILQFQSDANDWDGVQIWSTNSMTKADCVNQNGAWLGDVCGIESLFSGIVTYSVYDPSDPPVTPEPPAPTLTLDETPDKPVAQGGTGGLARLANGTGSYDVTVTLSGTDGKPLVGAAKELTIKSVPVGVALGTIVDNGDGTYTLPLTASEPGSYAVTVFFDGKAIGDSGTTPVMVNYIGIIGLADVIPVGQELSATGVGFRPGESVTVTVHSDAWVVVKDSVVGADGKVSVKAVSPAGLSTGKHTITFAGSRSGAVSRTFSYAAGANTGGSVAAGSAGSTAAAALLLTLGLGLGAVWLHRRSGVVL
ncbi:MAG: hypothetical protein FWF36_00590 [Propionibacteriaceae bacterium]|nr:hypothetical protein [Propionibacteriaceae bacterium]